MTEPFTIKEGLTNLYQMERELARAWLHRLVDEMFDYEDTKLGVSFYTVEDMTPRLMQLQLEWFDRAGEEEALN